MRQPWLFTGNTFNRATRTSNVKMLSIATSTDSRLLGQIANPAIQSIYDDYHPVFIAYRDIYNKYGTAVDTRLGWTFRMVKLIEGELKKQLMLWEGKIHNVYPEGTPDEKAYFPNKRKPFYHGFYYGRIETVGRLAKKLAEDSNPELSAYAPVVQNFYQLLSDTRRSQVGKEFKASLLSRERENQRKALAGALYTVLSRLMVLYHDDKERIKTFFDLSLIRTKKKDSKEIESKTAVSIPENLRMKAA